MIGSKTLGLVLAFAAVAGGAGALGSFAPERLMVRGFDTLLFAFSFGVVVGTAMFRLGHLGEKSGHYFRRATEAAAWDASEGHFVGGDRWRIVVGENRDGEALDLPRRARHGLCVALGSVLALAATDSRALAQLNRAPMGAVSMASSYCPEEVEAAAPARDPNEPGCELVRRAYALGYAKTLGQCAPKKEQRAEVARPPCTRRQRDEPLLHYSWRNLAAFWDHFRESTRVGYFTRARQDFSARAAHLTSLRSAEKEILTSAPHAAHHLWTNLPDPKDGAFQETTCTTRYLHLPHRPTPPPGPLQASLVLEHVVAQLLFEGTYDNAVGHCREYHVHWGAPLDACARLGANPEAALATDGALDSVKVTLERYRVAGDLAALGGPRPSADPASFVSFQCYFEGDAAPPAAAPREGASVLQGAERKSTPFSLGGRAFTAEEIHVPRAPPDASLHVDRYEAVARLLVKGFHYGSFLSEASPLQGTPAGAEASLAGPDYLLTRLYELESIDIYLDPGWIANRPDLLDVYPYERHLKNYVQVFRRQYRRERGRL